MSIIREEPAQRHLRGVHAPVHDELDVEDLDVSGAIPPELCGTFLRNGPNPMFEPVGRYHLFDGDGMLHAVDLAGGRATYRNRWVRSRGLEAEIAAGRALYGGMAEARFPGPDLVGDAGPMKNVANTNVVRHAGRTWCLWEAGPPTEVDDELATLGVVDFDGRLRGAFTAHPKVDPDTGTMYAFGYSAVPPYLRHHVIDADGHHVRTVDIDLPAPVMMHDFAITRRHAIYLDAPAHFDLAGFASGGPMLRWQPELGTRIGVMDRDGDGGDLRWFAVEDGYVFHFLNAYEEDDGSIVVDACWLSHLEIGLESADENSPGAYLSRIHINPSTGSVRREQITELAGDFPRIDDRRAGRRHRTGYLAAVSEPSTAAEGLFDSVLAVDLDRGTEALASVGHGRVCGEPVFAPDPTSTSDQDGWVLVHVADRSGRAGEVLVLAADAIDASPVARIHMPRRVPFGFHGNWIARD